MKQVNQIMGAAEFELRRIAGGRRLLIALFWVFLPALLALFISSVAKPSLREMENGFPLYLMNFLLQITLPLICLLYGAAMFRDELEDRSLTYLMITPTDKNFILVGKYFATVALLIPLAILSLVATAAFFFIPYGMGAFTDQFGNIIHFTLAATVGIFAYTAVFTLLGLLLRRSIIAGVIYILIFELMLSNFTQLSLYKMTILYYVRNLVQVESLTGLKAGTADLFREDWNTMGSGEALAVLLIASAVVLTISGYWLKRQEWESKPRD